MSVLTIHSVNKSFGSNRVVTNFDLSMENKEFISLLGPSGCGKTTVLRMVAGFETPSTGSIAIDGQDITTLRPNQRKIGMMFQSYALFPNLTAAGNVAFGLKVAGMSREEANKRVDEMLSMVGLSGFGGRYPFQLSGGQQQRVALARAIAPRPKVLLLDEPLSALDAKIRVSLRSEIRAIQQELGITTLFVTHDQEEAMVMSDRVVVMNGGRADQVGTPDEIYNRPATRFVAEFIGALNLVKGRLLDPISGEIETKAGTVKLSRPIKGSSGQNVSLAIRPEMLRLLHAGETGDGVTFSGKLVGREFLGAIIRIRVQIADEQSLIIDCFNRDSGTIPQSGQDIMMTVRPEEVVLLD
jgi:putative spermidine/putrescine transport system ATP-binding protein